MPSAVALRTTCNDAYDTDSEHCNESTRYVITKLVDKVWPLEVANAMIDHIVAAGWNEVTDREAAQLADTSVVVIAGLKNAAGEGHGLVTYPGSPKPRGGFDCNGTHDPPIGVPFPLSMSTSSLSWCGTRSKGDKTIRDAWSGSDWPAVKRWRQP